MPTWGTKGLSLGLGASGPEGLEPTVSAGERPKTYVVDRAATGTGAYHYNIKYKVICKCSRSITIT